MNTNMYEDVQILLDKGAYGEIMHRANEKKWETQILNSGFWSDLFCYDMAGTTGECLGEEGAGCCCCCCAVAGILGLSYVCTGSFGVGGECLSDCICELWDICCCCTW